MRIRGGARDGRGACLRPCVVDRRLSPTRWFCHSALASANAKFGTRPMRVQDEKGLQRSAESKTREARAAKAGQVLGGAMLCEPLMQSMCSLRHQCHAHGSLPHPVHHCTTCAPEARRVVQAPLRADRNACSRARCGFAQPFPLSYAGSRSHSDSDMRVRAADPHSHMQARSSCVLYSRFPRNCEALLQVSRQPRFRFQVSRQKWPS